MLKVYLLQSDSGKRLSRDLLGLALLERGIFQLPPIECSAQGKPYFPDYPQLHFNLSHSGSYALCALGDSPVGVDVEQVRVRNEVLLRRSLSEQEQLWMSQRGNHWADFYRLWTLKESKVKQSGQGLRLHPREIAVPLLGDDGLCKQGHLYYQSYAGTGWIATLCGLEPPEPLRQVTESQLLQRLSHL